MQVNVLVEYMCILMTVKEDLVDFNPGAPLHLCEDMFFFLLAERVAPRSSFSQQSWSEKRFSVLFRNPSVEMNC